MCDSKQKSSYKHVSDFRQLRSYGHFLIPVHALMRTAFTEPAGRIMNSASLVASTRYLDTWEECGEGGVS